MTRTMAKMDLALRDLAALVGDLEGMDADGVLFSAGCRIYQDFLEIRNDALMEVTPNNGGDHGAKEGNSGAGPERLGRSR